MRYVYGKKMKTLRDRLTTGFASLAIVASNASIGLPFLITQKATAAPAPQTTHKVMQADFANSMDTWTYHDDVLDSTDPLNAANPNPVAGQREIATKPAGATLDDFAAVKLTASGGQKFNLASLQYSGTKLSEIEALGFDLYTDNPSQAYINIDINFNSWKYGPGMLYHGRLIYVPQGVTANTWGSHEATGDGLWMWSGFDDNGNQWPDGATSPTRTWDSIVSTFPNAHISSAPYEFLLGKPFGSLYLRADGDSPVNAYFDNIYLATASENVKYNFEMPLAAITKPTVDYEAFGVLSEVDLEAHDIGAAGGNVQWAVRAGTCDPNTNTLFGNVDGFNTPFTWTGGNFTANISGLGEGEYCFVFNPNQGNRLTRWFTIQDTVPGLQDLDGDGNTDGQGSVRGLQTDTPSGGLGGDSANAQVLAASTGLAGTGALVMPFAFLGTIIIGASLLTVKRQKQD